MGIRTLHNTLIGLVRLTEFIQLRYECRSLETYEEHTVDVMDITVFPSAVVDIIPWHANLRAVENGRLRRMLKLICNRREKYH